MPFPACCSLPYCPLPYCLLHAVTRRSTPYAFHDGTVGLWSPSGTRLLTVAVPNAANNAVSSVALLPTRDGDGTNERLALVAGAHDGVARMWDATFSGKKASANASRVFVGHTAAIAEIAAAPGGDRFATASSDGTARVWRRNARRPVAQAVTACEP